MVSKKGVSKKGLLGFLQLVVNSSVYYQAHIVFDVAFRVDSYFVFRCGFK